MRTDAAGVPRMAGDTYRTWVSLGLTMMVTVAGGFVYGLFAVRRGWPLRGLVYLSALELMDFVVYFVVYQLLTWRVFHRAAPTQLVEWARATTPRTRQERRRQLMAGAGARSWALSAAGLSLFAVAAVALVPSLRTNPVILTSSLLVVVTGWLMVVFAFAVAYLRANAGGGGLQFPEDDGLVWSDYFYLAVQISTTFSSSDVTVATTKMRKLVTAQSLIAFVSTP